MPATFWLKLNLAAAAVVVVQCNNQQGQQWGEGQGGL
jgi:hypothetical protein